MNANKAAWNRDALAKHFANHENADVRFVANQIMTGFGKVSTLLRALYRIERAGGEIRSGNLWGQVRINGEQIEISELPNHA